MRCDSCCLYCSLLALAMAATVLAVGDKAFGDRPYFMLTTTRYCERGDSISTAPEEQRRSGASHESPDHRSVAPSVRGNS